MEPDLFRLSVNQFLQTARTVTFIIQKNADSIPDFEKWYRPRAAEWAADVVMNWAKNSRNTIEKEGDLELNSSLAISLFSSYIVEHDIQLITSREELLKAGVKRLVRFAQKNIPSNFISNAAIKIERRWVANTLPNWELLRAFSFIYSSIYRLCEALAIHLGSAINNSIQHPTLFAASGDEGRHVSYVKLSDLRTHRQRTWRMDADPSFKPPVDMKGLSNELKQDFSRADSPEKVLESLSRMAKATFEHFGNHVQMFLLYDSDMRCVDFLSGAFADQVEKYIFWRDLADRVVNSQATVVASIGEAWIRDMRGFYDVQMSNLPIIGERLFVNMLDSTGAFRSVSWDIVRDSEQDKPRLERVVESHGIDKIPFVFAPIFRAFGLPYPDYFL